MKTSDAKYLTEKQELKLEQNLIWVYGFPNHAVSVLSKQLVGNKINFLDKPKICREPGMIKLGLHSARTTWEWRDDPDYFFSKKFGETWEFYLKKLILARIFSQFQDLSNKIIINEPQVVGSASIISKIFSNSKIIFLIEDNLPTFVKLFSKQVLIDRNKLGLIAMFDLEEKEIQKISSIKFQKFKEIIMDVYDSRSSNSCYLVKYNEIKQNPFTELKKIYEFSGIETNDDELKKMITKFKFEYPKKVDKPK